MDCSLMYTFDSRKSFSEYDPRLVAPTCLYLASKAEESTVQAKLLVFYMKKIRMNFTSLFTRKLVLTIGYFVQGSIGSVSHSQS